MVASLHLCLSFCPAYLIGKCIGQGEERERERSGYFVRRGSEEKRRERETANKCVVGTL